jgi:cytochrome c553
MSKSNRVVGCWAAVTLSIHAASTFAAAETPIGDAKRGATVAATCQACHGAKGEGVPASGFPRLAGQTETYLDKQLVDYVSGSRASAVMGPLAKQLNDQQRADVAAYYASLSPPRAAQNGPSDPKVLARGRLLSGTGDEAKHLQSCGNCHGPDGSGVAFSAPYLAGQSTKYLTDAIGEWKSGARKNDDGMLMALVASYLDDADIAAISVYFSSLEPPKP